MTVDVHHLTARIGTKAARARFESPKRHFREERFDLLTRKVYPVAPPKVEYKLTALA